MITRPLLPLACLLASAPLTFAQSLNVDVGSSNSSIPSAAYAAAASQAGVWTRVSAAATSPVALKDLAGTTLSATLLPSGGLGDFGFNNAATTGDDQNLLDDAMDINSPPLSTGTATWTFSNLVNGTYSVYTYGWAPDDVTYRTGVAVQGAVEGTQLVGGAWAGTHAQGLTYALHHVTIGNGTIVVNVQSSVGLGCVNGFQLIKQAGGGPIATFCFGDGSSTLCPCGNLGTAGRGCENSASTGGAQLAGSGNLNPDALVLSVTGELPTALTIFLQGDVNTAPGSIFGDGVRCTGGNLKRLYAKSAVGGAVSAPAVGDLGVRAQSAALGDVIPAGATRYYQAYYRDASPSFCAAPPGNTFNVSNAVSVIWP